MNTITNTITTTDTTTADIRARVLAHYAAEEGAEDSEVTEGYDANEYEIDGGSYLVLTDEEADELAREKATESLWAFSSEFLRDYTGALATVEGRKAFDKMRESLCEGAQDFVIGLLGDNLEECVGDAIAADGRGHFLAGYDSEERECRFHGQIWYLYRTN